jgi:hypothetical protein
LILTYSSIKIGMENIIAGILLLGCYEVVIIMIVEYFLFWVNEITDYIIDLFNNLREGIIMAWAGKKRQRMPKRFFLSGCTG